MSSAPSKDGALFAYKACTAGRIANVSERRNTMTHIIHKTIKSRADGLELSVLEIAPEGKLTRDRAAGSRNE